MPTKPKIETTEYRPKSGGSELSLPGFRPSRARSTIVVRTVLGGEVAPVSLVGKKITIDGETYTLARSPGQFRSWLGKILTRDTLVAGSPSASEKSRTPAEAMQTESAAPGSSHTPMNPATGQADPIIVDHTTPNLAVEIAAFERDLPTLLATHSGEYAVYIGDERAGLFPSFQAALGFGYDATRFQRTFLVRCIEVASDEASTWELGRAID